MNSERPSWKVNYKSLQTSARITDIASARVYALLTLVVTKIDVVRTLRGRGFTAGRIGFKEVAPALKRGIVEKDACVIGHAQACTL